MWTTSLNDGLDGLGKPLKACFGVQATCLKETLKALGEEEVRFA